jgi:hypothetical protein
MNLDVPVMSISHKPPKGPVPDAQPSNDRNPPLPEREPLGASIHQISTVSMFMLKARSNELLDLICDTRDRS